MKIGIVVSGGSFLTKAICAAKAFEGHKLRLIGILRRERPDILFSVGAEIVELPDPLKGN